MGNTVSRSRVKLRPGHGCESDSDQASTSVGPADKSNRTDLAHHATQSTSFRSRLLLLEYGNGISPLPLMMRSRKAQARHLNPHATQHVSSVSPAIRLYHGNASMPEAQIIITSITPDFSRCVVLLYTHHTHLRCPRPRRCRPFFVNFRKRHAEPYESLCLERRYEGSVLLLMFMGRESDRQGCLDYRPTFDLARPPAPLTMPLGAM